MVFVNNIKEFLIGELLACCLSQEKMVYNIATQVFLYLINHFKCNIKKEIYVFMQNITLSILNSNHCGDK